MSFWDTLRIGETGLSAQRLRMDLVSNNIANAQTTHTASGGPYQRQDVVFSTQQSQSAKLPSLVLARLNSQSSTGAQNFASGLSLSGVQISQIVTDKTPGQSVYDPTNPDADANGNVTYPNVNLAVEMTNMISASRSYEANLQVIDAAKQMALRALDIGK